MEVKYGKWKGHAIVVRKAAKEKLQLVYFAQKQKLEKGNSERSGLKILLLLFCASYLHFITLFVIYPIPIRVN